MIDLVFLTDLKKVVVLNYLKNDVNGFYCFVFEICFIFSYKFSFIYKTKLMLVVGALEAIMPLSRYKQTWC